MRVLLGAVAMLLLGAPAAALADTRMTLSRGILYFINEDAGVGNRLTVDRDARGRAHFVDEADPAGINYPSPACSPGKLNNTGNAVEVFCDTDGVTGVTIQLGPGEDRAVYGLADLPGSLEGADGADTLTGGGAADALDGGQGNDALDGGAGDDVVNGGDADDKLTGGDGADKIDGGAGTDAVTAGAGDDLVRAADGIGETLDCGDGSDTVDVDARDTPTACETVNRLDVAGPAAGPAADDGRTPVLRMGGSTSQRVSSARRTIVVAVTVSKPASIAVSGFLDAGDINDRIRPSSAKVTVGGGGTQLRITLSRAQARRVLADLRRRRRPRLMVTASAVDAAGRTSRAKHLRIFLRR